MKKPNTTKSYKLTRESAPLSFMLPTRNTKRFPLLYFDEKTQTNKALRYAKNQKSPFEEEQDGEAILEPIVFEDGFLTVPRTNPVLQEFLHYHPMNGIRFVEVDQEKDAQGELEVMNSKIDALSEARGLTTSQLENVARVLFGVDPSKLTTSELKRDVLVYASKEPAEFIQAINDPNLRLSADVQRFFDNRLLAYRNNQKDVYYNTPSNKKRMLTVPFGEDPIYVVSSYLQSDEGLDVLKHLESLLDE